MLPPKVPGYNLELEKLVQYIKREKCKTICLQCADGLKPYALPLVEYLESETDAKVVIWLDTNWGSCDYPAFVKGIDLLVNIGHTSPVDLMPNPE
ncbi:MAG TPA: diphthamide synthesis protein [Candidatus Nanoarchaeia archaeon]|nr:diphthamide synthesis protein [Candidatus Nanoarchaeia archaeon]